MNYRHAFHAGNHTEVFKHSVLTFLLDALRRKPKPFVVLDTHAGIGVYDLRSEQAQRTHEKKDGIERVAGLQLRCALEYQEAIMRLNTDELVLYPGSPEITRSVLRENDRLVLCELHAEDAATLRRRYKDDRRVLVHQRDGYEAIGALLPPEERRGLVFMDPPFEKTDETASIEKALRKGFRKWATGIYLVWYPIKSYVVGDLVEAAAAAAGFTSILRADFCPYRLDGVRLAGGGVVICNPPWTLDNKIQDLCRELMPLLGDGQGAWTVRRTPSMTAGAQ